MICSVCGSEFDIENFDVCPYCLTPVQLDVDNESVEVTEVEDIPEQVVLDENIPEYVQEKANLYEDDYEVTEDDLIDDCKETNNEILIDDLGLSVRAMNAFHRAKIYTLNELIEFLAVNSISDIRNVGAKTVRETEELMERLRTNGIDSIVVKSKNEETEETFIFENISADVDYLCIDALAELGLKKKIISELLKHDIKCCERLRKVSKSEFVKIGGKKCLDDLAPIATFLEKDIISLLSYVLENHRDSREYSVVLRRARGETLQEIATNPDNEGAITRERVRQIEKKYLQAINPYVRELLYILKGSKKYISSQDILDIFDDDEYDQILLYVTKSCGEFEYLDFAEIFVDKNDSYSIEEKLLEITRDIVEDGIDLLDNRENIEEALAEHKMDYINLDSIINLLKKYNYSIYGNFATKGKSNYATACMHIVKTHFKNGIKLSQRESEHSEDLILLRKIIEEKYPGLSVPTSDRSLSSTLTRSGLILRGRGLYIPQENVTVDETLLQDIKNYIDSKDSNKVFYNEIYSDFEGALNFLCGVDNYNYLHGILAMRYPDSYEYGRDYLLKNGVKEENTESIADRIYAFICKMGRPVSKSELFNEFRGFSTVMITMPFVNDLRLMQWEYNYFTCRGVLDITEEDSEILKECIYDLFDENNGYASDGLFYDKVKEKHPEFIKKNGIKSEMNLHYIASKLYSEEMEFRRPHIGVKNKIDISSTQNVALYLLNNPECFTYKQYISICDKMKWSIVTAGMVLSSIEEDYVRISVDDYVKKEFFSVPEEILHKTKYLLYEHMENGILSLMNLDMDEFPEFQYNWNAILLETIIKQYFDDLDVIQPSMKDRRYQKGIVVKKAENLSSYSQIVARKMKIIGKEKMTESQFLTFLIVQNLALKAIPNELSNSDYVKKEGDYYYVIK